MKSKKIALTGYYGFSNYGDDLFSLACSWGSREYWSAHDVKIVGPSIPGVKARYSVPSFFPRKWYAAPGAMGKFSRLLFLLSAIIQNDLLILAGGSTLSSLGSKYIRKIQYIATKAKMIQIAGIGVSVGPFLSKNDQHFFLKFLENFSFLSVRDSASYKIIQGLNLKQKSILSKDLAGIVPLALAKQKYVKKTNLLGIALCDYKYQNSITMRISAFPKKAIFRGIRDFAQNNKISVRIFSLNSHPISGDDTLAADLYKYLSKVDIEIEIVSFSTERVDKIWQKIAECSAMFSIRLHGAITAYLNDVPFSLVEYHKKCSDFLIDIGQPASLRLSSNIPDSKIVVEVLEKLFNMPPKSRLDTQQYMEEAKLNFTAAPWA